MQQNNNENPENKSKTVKSKAYQENGGESYEQFEQM